MLLRQLGAAEAEMEGLLAYCANRFIACEPDSLDFAERWVPVFRTAGEIGAAAAINRHLVKEELRIPFQSPEGVTLEMCQSISGAIPLITAQSTADFEALVQNIVYKGREVPGIADMGASFAFGKTNRFIILSNKPYANVPAHHMGIGEAEWAEKSLTIRKYHEIAHYFTKRFYGSSQNNLHDELLADFYGVYSAFGAYKAEWFLRFMGLEDGFKPGGRFQIYTRGLSEGQQAVVAKLAALAAEAVARWAASAAFAGMDDKERIQFLCENSLLSWAEGYV